MTDNCYFCDKPFSCNYYLKGRKINLCDGCFLSFLQTHNAFGYDKTFRLIKIFEFEKDMTLRISSPTDAGK
jgi:hypothetical protein